MQSYLLSEQLSEYDGKEEHDEFSSWYADVEQAVHEHVEAFCLVVESGWQQAQVGFDGFQLAYDGRFPQFGFAEVADVGLTPEVVHVFCFCAFAELWQVDVAKLCAALSAAQCVEAVAQQWSQGSHFAVRVAAHQSSNGAELLLCFAADVPVGELQYDVEVFEQCLPVHAPVLLQFCRSDFQADVEASFFRIAVHERCACPLPVVPEAVVVCGRGVGGGVVATDGDAEAPPFAVCFGHPSHEYRCVVVLHHAQRLLQVEAAHNAATACAGQCAHHDAEVVGLFLDEQHFRTLLVQFCHQCGHIGAFAGILQAGYLYECFHDI